MGVGMNGHENDLLNKIWDDIKEVKQDIKETKNKSQENAEQLAQTSEKVEQLSIWVGNINNTIQTWTTTGCPRGMEHNTRLITHDREIQEIKADVKEALNSKKEASMVGAGAGSSMAVIFNVIMSYFGKG